MDIFTVWRRIWNCLSERDAGVHESLHARGSNRSDNFSCNGIKMIATENAYDIIKSFENLELKTYPCPAGELTIGYGHTKGVKRGQTITKEEADRLLHEDVQDFEDLLNKALDDYRIKVNQNQFDALIVFSFNLGVYTLVHGGKDAPKSHIGQVWQALLDKDYPRAADKLLLYINKGTPYENGLLRRRKAERELFLKPASDYVYGVEDW